MKKNFLVILILIFFFTISVAQNNNEKGIKLAYTSSYLHHSNIDNFTERRAGFNIALYHSLHTYRYISLLIQIEYNQKGFVEKLVEKNSHGEFVKNVEARTRLDYVSMPFFFKLNFPNSIISPYLLTGLRIDYLFYRANGIYNFSTINIQSAIADDIDNFVFGYSIGGGLYLFNIDKYKTFLEFRYNLDFTNSLSKYENINVKNNSFDIWVGIAL